MSLEELRALVADKQADLEARRKSRNKAQVEHASLQTYYNVTREEISMLDMKIDKIDLEIENAEEDNATELKVYEQKSKFLQYCHDNKVKAALEEGDLKQQKYNTDQERRLSELETAQDQMMVRLNEIETRQALEIKISQAEINQELGDIKQNLDNEIKQFEDDCDKQHAQLKEELKSKRKAELDIINSRKDSHLQDLIQSHEKTCQEMKGYFDEIEKEQEIEMEKLQMKIRRLKKAEIQHGETRERLETSNTDDGKELDDCMKQVRVRRSLLIVLFSSLI
jgi:hypothetical protein